MTKKGPTKPLHDEALKAIARRFQALSDPVRLKLLHLLREGECSVGEIARLAGCSQPNASRQLSQLHSQKLLKRRQRGNTVLYAISDPSIFALCETVCGRLEEDAERWSRLLAGGEPEAE